MFNIKSNLLIRSFLLGLICVSSLFAYKNWPVGTKYVIPVTINHLKVGGALTNFPVRLDCSTLLATNAKFKSNITTVNNICVYDTVTELLRPKIVLLDLVNNNLTLGFDAALSSTVDKTYFICVGTGVNVVNSMSVFTNSNVSNHWGFNEPVESATVQDMAGGATSTLLNVVLGAAGVFSTSADFSGTSASVITNTTLPSEYSVELIFYYAGLVSGRYTLISNYLSASGTIISIETQNNVSCYTSSGSVNSPPNSLVVNSWNHVAITKTTGGILNVWINKNRVVTNVQTGNPAGGTIYIGARNGLTTGFNNKIDEVTICNAVQSPERATTSYENIMNPSTFRTFGAGFSVGSGGRRSNRTVHTGVSVSN